MRKPVFHRLRHMGHGKMFIAKWRRPFKKANGGAAVKALNVSIMQLGEKVSYGEIRVVAAHLQSRD